MIATLAILATLASGSGYHVWVTPSHDAVVVSRDIPAYPGTSERIWSAGNLAEEG